MLRYGPFLCLTLVAVCSRPPVSWSQADPSSARALDPKPAIGSPSAGRLKETVPLLVWEQLEQSVYEDANGGYAHSLVTERASVKGGWLVRARIHASHQQSFSLPTTHLPTGGGSGGLGVGMGTGLGLTFIPDPNHEWTRAKP